MLRQRAAPQQGQTEQQKQQAQQAQEPSPVRSDNVTPSSPITNLASSVQQQPMQLATDTARNQKPSSKNPANPAQAKSTSITTQVVPHIPACMVATYKHKKLSTHASDDECSHHRNLIKLARTDANAGTLCIRVNGTAVHFEKTASSDEFIIGAVAGPKDVITASFCVANAKCPVRCVYPAKEPKKKDEFLNAIGADGVDNAEPDPSAAQWQAGDSAKNRAVDQALSPALRKQLAEREAPNRKLAANNSALGIFKDWQIDNESEACAQ